MERLLLIYIFSMIYLFAPSSLNDEIDYYALVFERAVKYGCNINLADKYARIILSNSEKNNLSSDIVSRIVSWETGFNSKRGNGRRDYKDIAIGPMHVKPYYWGHWLYYIDDKKLKQQLKDSKNIKEDFIKNLKNIEYGIEIGCRVLRWYINYSEDNIYLALVGYNNGQNTKIYEYCRKGKVNPINTSYVSNVLWNTR